MELSRGVLIAIEGIDGAGKTTQAHRLQSRLIGDGYRVSVFKEPTGGKWGQMIRSLALKGRGTAQDEMDLFLKDRIEDVQQNIMPAMARNEVVIMDRYYLSSIAYQGVLGLPAQQIQKANEEVAPKPDVFILLDVSPRIGIRRIEFGRQESPNHFEKEAYLKKVRAKFQEMADESFIQVVEASEPLESVAAHVYNIATDIIRPWVARNGRPG